jgi:phosphatidate cytidylyltransferase
VAGNEMAARAPVDAVAGQAVGASGSGAAEQRATPEGVSSGGAGGTKGATASASTAPGGNARGERSGVLFKRVVAGFAIAVPVLLGVYAGGVWFFLGTSLISFLALREFYRLAARPGARLLQPLGFLLAFVLLLAHGGYDLLWSSLAVPGAAGDLGGGGLSDWLPAASLEPFLRPDRLAVFGGVALTAAVILPLVALLFEHEDPRGRLTGWALTLAGTLYVAWLISHFQTLRLLGGPGSQDGRGWVFYVLAATWCFDTGAYLIGRRFGRHRFMPRISPQKTWEGVGGGLACCLLATLVASLPIPPLADLLGWTPLPIPLWQVPLLGLAVAGAAQLGDLAESMIKREAGAKDAGDLIPGHGGMLDRVDSLLFTVVLVYYYAAAIVFL